jgi:DNA adenine methylase
MDIPSYKPILRWMGGKSKLAPFILSQFPKHTCYVEAFCGGAAILLRKPRSKSEVINDIDGELINLYRCIKYHPEELAKQSVGMLHSRWLFERLKSQSAIELTDIQRAARYYAINRMAFGGGMKSPSFGYARSSSAGLSATRFENDIAQLSKRLDRVFIENLSWDGCITRYDSANTLIYCDPPYFGTTGYGMTFDMTQYVKMAELAKSIKGKMVISVNDITEMRDIFADFDIQQLGIKYSRGRGVEGVARKEAFELLIKNF